MSIERPDPAFEEAEADRRLGANNRDAFAMLAKADNRMRAGDHRAASAYYGRVSQLAAQGAAIARSEVERAGEASAWLARRFRDAIADGLAARGITPSQMHPRFALSLAIMFGERQRAPAALRYPQLPRMYFYPELPQVEFADLSDAPWVEAVETKTDQILAEAQALLTKDGGFAPYVKATQERPQGDVHGLLENASWSTLDLTEKGAPAPERVALAPQTWDAISSNAPLCSIVNRAPSVMFSLLQTGSRIPPHTGMINTRFVCHLPLIVPGNGALRVGTSEREWEYGRLMVFDDSIEHEAWNNAAEDRLVLIFDVWRPELSAEERAQIGNLFEVVDAY